LVLEGVLEDGPLGGEPIHCPVRLITLLYAPTWRESSVMIRLMLGGQWVVGPHPRGRPASIQVTPVVIQDDETSLLEVDSTAFSMIFLAAESTTTWVELTWTDQLGVVRQQRVELD
jgi:hypothetical protein